MDVKFAVTKKCNLRCRHCHYSAGSPSPDELKTSEAMDAIDQVAEQWDEVRMTFTGGEALLRNDLFELISYAYPKIGHLDLASNAILIDDETASTLKKCGIKQVIVGIDGIGKSHDKIRGKESFKKALQGIKAVKNAGLDLLISHCITKENPYDFKDVFMLADDLDAKTCIAFHYIPLGRSVIDLPQTNHDGFLAESLMELYTEQQKYKNIEICTTTGSQYWVVLRRMREKGFEVPDFYDKALPGCRAGKGIMSIRDNGDILPCPLLKLVAGNLRESSLAEIFETKLMKEICDHKNYKGKCKECKHNDICGGCRVRAHEFTQDYLAEDPVCSDFFFEKA